MKKIAFLIIVILGIQFSFSQNNYDSLWKEVESLELEGKFKTANERVDKILRKAKRTNQSDQIVKGFIYKSKFALLLEENAQRNIISKLEETIAVSQFPSDVLLESVYASFLQQYLAKNRYNIRNRTKIDSAVISGSFETWDITTFHKQITLHYGKSIQNVSKLKSISIRDFQEILTNSRISYKFRPTLYDFLVHRALSFYSQDKGYLKRPEDRFYIDNPAVFESSQKFIETPFYTPDSILSKRPALKLYQKLEAFHKSRDTIAFVDVVLDRLRFCWKEATIVDKDQHYLKGLLELLKVYPNHEASATIDHEMASFYFESSKRSKAKKDPQRKDYRIKAMEICNRAIERFPNSDGGLLCKILKNKIEEQSIIIQTERYVVPEKPFFGKSHF